MGPVWSARRPWRCLMGLAAESFLCALHTSVGVALDQCCNPRAVPLYSGSGIVCCPWNRSTRLVNLDGFAEAKADGSAREAETAPFGIHHVADRMR